MGALTSVATGSTYTAVTADDVGSLEIPDRTLAEQRTIADYLDAETARIDALLTAKQRLVHLLEERQRIEVETEIRRLGDLHGLGPLKHYAGPITVGIVITPAKWYVDRGVPAVRGLNVSAGHIDMAEAVYLSEDGHRENAKSALRSGDVVVVRTGQAGAAAVVPAELDGANCIDLLIIRASKKLRPRFLEYVLNSDWTMKHIGEHSVGSIQAHFNVAALREVPVPVPPIEVQDRSIEHLDSVAERHRRTVVLLAKQLELLAEHRQALITAGVTRELPAPGGRIMATE
jgi:type I restriction enzyme, S subunit